VDETIVFLIGVGVGVILAELTNLRDEVKEELKRGAKA